MSLDRHAADRRRFARLLGLDERDGLGLPIGLDRSVGDEPTDPTRADESEPDPTGSRDR
ncbi:hypothetical protein QA600_02000 [Natronococcus sp. A-GB1]|uniref:Uncharacterized protein n=1 Tax=Natronococcus amylolyticus DSM 10524 TaxID=1227497 RepID=L9XD62_9EURY|nr:MULTISPECIES: hypothetical protein [Natronococcus]ELY59654.1 hypothetical protein C491_04781 [Natronococcus amylolyticus DSM 10524]MDG5758109.1 hypothetical protein [Natronococcus sp. A-GB1]